MNELHLFAGAGGGILGGILLGHTTVCAVEIEPYCRKVLLQRQRDGILPKFPIWDDVRTFDGRPWRGKVDVVCGGYPCQAFSTASHQNKTAIDLWPEMFSIIKDIEPKYVFAENVCRKSIESSAIQLCVLGYSCYITRLSAADVGADHKRIRYWLLAHANDQSKLHLSINAKVVVVPQLQESLWKAPPGNPRISDGLASTMDRYKAAGNGQVPSVVALAWRVLGGPVNDARTIG